MNTGFYNNLDTNFEQAYIMCEKNFSHEELVAMLNNGNIPEKQIAALKFDSINSIEDADVLMNNLTGCDGKIREAVALKINKLISENENCRHFFFKEVYADIFANATIDINANICRLVTDSIRYLIENKNFITLYSNNVLNFAQESLDELDRFVFRDKKYIINKQLFKLYWCLEAFKTCYKYLNNQDFNNVLKRSSSQKEYTIREKVAEILILDDFTDLLNIRNQLKDDDNYYVRRAISL